MSLGFKEATDVLLGTLSHEELASGLGSSVASLRQARLEPQARAFRKPPEGWELVVARLAELRAKRLQRLSKALQRAYKASRKRDSINVTNRLSQKKPR
jgi:hypothetical protein